MFTVKSFRNTERTDYKQALMVRRQVFVQEQGVEADLEFDEHEAVSMHYLLTEGE